MAIEASCEEYNGPDAVFCDRPKGHSGAHRGTQGTTRCEIQWPAPAVPQMPGFFQAYLTGLADHQAQAMYEWAVGAGPSNYVSLAIQDATQSRGNDVYGEGV